MALSVGFQISELYSFKQDHTDNFIAYINLANINDKARIRNMGGGQFPPFLLTASHILDRSVKGEVREWYNNIQEANARAITGAVNSFPNVSLSFTETNSI
ncbi:5472_t:CDS:2 [Funneliformis geosporum]|nr:5472_t:CDS:2 [Funneliformis geosporum]